MYLGKWGLEVRGYDGWGRWMDKGERCGLYSKGHIIIKKRNLCNGLFEVRDGVVW
jgi:hypothetical protein